MYPRHHICVCICTYKRPELLRRLLSKLEGQETEGLFDYSIVIVDNDRAESARQMTGSYRQLSKVSISYYVEAEQNIALARNKTIENAKGDFIGLIDDDEFPGGEWLLNLYKAMNRYNSDGILGPVFPYYEDVPPRWIIRGGLWEKPTHETGYVLQWTNTRTSNALLKKHLFDGKGNAFDPRFGSGGEDKDFFKRMIEMGHVFTWCNEAPVYEVIPQERWRRLFLLKRALLRGKASLNYSSFGPVDILKSIVAVPAYSLALPLLFLLGHHVFMKYLIKDCDHIGLLLSLVGVDIVKEKYVMK